ncbi:MAG: phospholipase [Planctomycetota bacterium]
MLRQLTDIQERMDRGPIRIRIVTANEANFAAEQTDAQDRLNELRKASNEKQMQLAEREAKIEDMKGKLNACDSNKEFQLLKDRIAADEQANFVLQDEILEQLERMDVLTEALNTAKANHEKAKSETVAMKDKVALELSELEAEQQRVREELGESEGKLPISLREDYQRLVAAKGENAFAVTNTENCDNCHQRCTTQMKSNLMMQLPVKCAGCGSILYVVQR